MKITVKPSETKEVFPHLREFLNERGTILFATGKNSSDEYSGTVVASEVSEVGYYSDRWFDKSVPFLGSVTLQG